MPLTELLVKAQKRQEELEAIKTQKAVAEKDELSEKLAIELGKFERALKEDAGDIFDNLDKPPAIEPRLDGQTILRARVFHRTVSVVLVQSLTPVKQWRVCDTSDRQYLNKKASSCDRQEYVYRDKLSDYLLVRFLKIAEEYDRLLVEIEREKELEVEKRAANERLRLFSEALYVAAEKSSEQLKNQVEKEIESRWVWPQDFVLELYKISWCTGAYRNDEYKEAEFDYDSGWSLTDVSVLELQWFALLSERHKSKRAVKTSSPITVERFRFTEENLPDCLFDYPEKFEKTLVRVAYSLDGRKHCVKLLPNFVPPFPEDCTISTEECVGIFDLRRLPCMEIQQAIDALTYGFKKSK
jgi:hypothetical protein